MSIEDRAKAATQNAEGKTQAAVGAVTGDRQEEMAGKAKQVGAHIRDGVEDAKDKVVETAKKVGDKIEDGIDRSKEEINK